MRQSIQTRLTLIIALITSLIFPAFAIAADPLPSWNDGGNKSAILKFVTAVTSQTSPDFVEPAERIATFDNDGTLWVEAPMYTQLMFAFDRVKAMAPNHPEWKDDPVLEAVLKDDMKADADIPMLQWTLAGEGRRLGMLVHHTDAQREFAYDRKSIVGKLDQGIDNAKSGGWSLIDMKADWARVFSK